MGHLHIPLEEGTKVLLEGRLHRWSAGKLYDKKTAHTGIEVEAISVIG